MTTGRDDLAAARTVWSDPSRARATRIAALLGAMTVPEKVAHLTGTWQGADRTPDMADEPDSHDADVDGGRAIDDGSAAIDGGSATTDGDGATTDGDGSGAVAPMTAAMKSDRTWEEIRTLGVGHLTRVFGTSPINVDDGVARLAAFQRDLQEQSRLGVPAIAHEECLTGFTTLGATVHPSPLALAATFDPDLVTEVATSIGTDMRAVGVHQALAPLLDVVQDPRWGRTEETFGEDPHLVGTMGAAYVAGLEATGLVATCKHFAGYASSRAARNHAPVSMGPREFADVVLVPFEMALRLGGARSVMNSYADVDGLPPAANAALLTDLLRDQWGFEGTVVSDYGAVAFLSLVHRVAASVEDAAAIALEAGMDVELPEAVAFGPDLARRVETGHVDEALLDRALERVLGQKLDLGLLDEGWSPTTAAAVDLDSAANRTLARLAAARSLVLLSNDGTLPLATGADSPGRIAVIGPGSADPAVFLGCYSYPNHVLPMHPDVDMGIEVPVLVDAIRQGWPASVVDHEVGTGVQDGTDDQLSAAVAAARAADVVVLALADLPGMFGRGTSGEGNDAGDLWLPGRQGELADAVLATGTPTVAVVISGRPYALGSISDRAAAVVQAFLPGQEAAPAIASLVAGDIEPQGRLPIQVPREGGGMPAGFRHPVLGEPGVGISMADTVVAHPFGHGLSWTQFSLGEPSSTSVSMATDGMVTVSCVVSNTGSRDGTAVVQLYVDDPVAQVVRPIREFLGFARVPLAVGDTASVSFEIHADRLGYTGPRGHRIVESGTVRFLLGQSSGDLPLRVDVEVTGPTRVVGHDRVLTTPATVS